MNLDDKGIYLEERNKLLRLSTQKLETMLGELHTRRFDNNDISIDAYYRMVSHVYYVKVGTGKSLIFHMQKFLGIVVGLIISSYLYTR